MIHKKKKDQKLRHGVNTGEDTANEVVGKQRQLVGDFTLSAPLFAVQFLYLYVHVQQIRIVCIHIC